MKLKLNAETSIDLKKLIESRLLIQANSGGGKSWAIRRLIEQAFGKVQIIILDAEGEFTNLREKYDFVYAGKDGDTIAEPRAASLLARRLLELKASAIVDLYELSAPERKKFVRIFCETMVDAPKELWHDCLVILDEAHVFAPEKGESEAMGPVIDLATRGRKRGYCIVLATQRFSKLNKDAAAECNNKLIGRASQDIDMKRAADELGFTSRDQMLALRLLKPGEFYAFGPAISDEIEQIKIGDVSMKPQARGVTKSIPPPPTSKVRELLSKLADLPKEAEKEASTIADYKQKIATLEREKRILEKAPGAKPEVIEQAVAKEVEKARKEIEKNANIEIEKERAEQVKINKEWQILLNSWVAFAGALEKILTQGQGILERFKEIPKPDDMQIKLPEKRKVALESPKHVPVRPPANPPARVLAESGTGGAVSRPEQKVLNSLGWFESISLWTPSKISVAFLAGYSGSSGGYNNLCGMLRAKGYIDYPSPGNMSLTDAGRAIAEIPKKPLSQDELHEKILETLPTSEGKVLKPLLEAYPSDLSIQELADASGYQVSSGGFNNLKGRLRSLGLAEYPSTGRVKAASILFIQ